MYAWPSLEERGSGLLCLSFLLQGLLAFFGVTFTGRLRRATVGFSPLLRTVLLPLFRELIATQADTCDLWTFRIYVEGSEQGLHHCLGLD